MKIFRFSDHHLRLPIFFLALILGGCRQEPEVVQVPVGIVVSLTGPFGAYGKIQQNGINLALSEINESSYLPGVELVPILLDDQSAPDTCKKIYRKLISNDKVLAIIGPTSSNCAFPADSVAQENKVVVLGISNTVPGLTEIGNYIFRNSLPESTVIPNTISQTKKLLGYGKVAIIYGIDDPYTTGAYSAFRSSLENTSGVTIVATETVHKGDTDFTAQLQRVKASNPDVIVMPALVNEAAGLMVQARQMGIPPSVRFIGGNSFNTSRLWQLAGEASQGAICGCAWIYSEDTPGNSQFVSTYTSTYGSKPDQFAAQAYAAIFILADAIKRSSPLSSMTLRDQLANTSSLATVLGTFSFDAMRNPIHPPVVQELVNGEFFIFK